MTRVRSEVEQQLPSPADTAQTPESVSRSQLVRRSLRSPLLLLWIFTGIGVAGGIVEWLFLGGLPWEGLGTAMFLAGLTELVARVRHVPAWPWHDRPRD